MRVDYWYTTRGDSPVLEYIDSLAISQPREANAIIEDIVTLREFGYSWMVSIGKVKKLQGHPLWELKSGPHRTIFPVIKNTALLVHSFRKDSKKTRLNHVELSMKRCRTYQVI